MDNEAKRESAESTANDSAAKATSGPYTREYVEWYLTEIGDTSSALNDLDPLLARQIAEYQAESQREKATESGGLG